MGKKGPSRHLKRHPAPDFWPVPKKSKVWAVKSKPGPHPLRESMPLNVVVRDVLKYAETGKEAKALIKEGKLVVDGKSRIDERYPVGLMDVLSVPDAGASYRVLPERGGRLKLHPIEGGETGFKLCRIMGKSTLKGGRTQLNLHDGRSVVIPADEDRYRVNDVVQVNVPEQEIVGHISFEEGARVVVTGGRSQGESGRIIGFSPEPGWKKTATIRTPEGEDIRTLAGYLFAVGEEEPVISLPGGH